MSLSRVHLLSGEELYMQSCSFSSEQVFLRCLQLLPDRVYRIHAQPSGHHQAVAVGTRIDVSRMHRRLLCHIRQSHADLITVDANLVADMESSLHLGASSLSSTASAYNAALCLWVLCASSNIRVIGSLANLLCRLELTILVQLGTKMWSFVEAYLDSLELTHPFLCKMLLRRRHDLLRDLAETSSAARAEYFLRVWASLSKRELDDVSLFWEAFQSSG